MKTATVPNSPELTELMELTAELSVVSGELERWHQNEFIKKVGETIDNNFDKLKGEFDRLEIDEYDEKFVRQCVAYCALTVAEDTITHIGMMERNLGLTGQNAPAEVIKSAFDVLHATQFKLIATYWDEV